MKHLGDDDLKTLSFSYTGNIFQRRRPGFDAAEDLQFASMNQKIHTLEGTDLATDGMSLELPLSQMWANVESDADPTAGGMIECSGGAVGRWGS